MTKESLAELLNGRQRNNEITDEECKIARNNRLLVCFPYSDDNLELRGALTDEYGCYDGGRFFLYKGCNGYRVCTEDDIDTLREAIDELEMDLTLPIRDINAIWLPEDGLSTWLINTQIPHAKFNIADDDLLFARCVIIDLKEI